MNKPTFAASASITRRASLLASVIVLAIAGQALAAAKLPSAITGPVTHVHGNSGLLTAAVNPRGTETSYFFEYGPTLTYGSVTPTVAIGKGTTPVKVGQTVNIRLGYHYRVVAKNEAGVKHGSDRTFTSPSATRLKFTLASTKEAPPTPYGGTFVLRGTLAGPGSGGHPIQAESSPFPYLTAFSPVLTAPLVTSPSGGFAIQVPNLRSTTQLRVSTRDARPVISPIITARVSPRVVLKVRSAGAKGLYRLYGTVTPAKVGAPVLFQLEKATRPHGEAETAVRWVTHANTVVKRGTRTMSRFSSVVKVVKSGHYRAYVQLHSGALVSGWSTSVTLHAAPATKKTKK